MKLKKNKWSVGLTLNWFTVFQVLHNFFVLNTYEFFFSGQLEFLVYQVHHIYMINFNFFWEQWRNKDPEKERIRVFSWHYGSLLHVDEALIAQNVIVFKNKSFSGDWAKMGSLGWALKPVWLEF